jgi:hypothetical protein
MRGSFAGRGKGDEGERRGKKRMSFLLSLQRKKGKEKA